MKTSIHIIMYMQYIHEIKIIEYIDREKEKKL